MFKAAGITQHGAWWTSLRGVPVTVVASVSENFNRNTQDPKRMKEILVRAIRQNTRDFNTNLLRAL